MIPFRSRFVFPLARFICMSPVYNAHHYDVLGVTPKATQSDIKSAYYKLSKIHHPDKSKDEESANKFRAITEAYEVLSNIQLKKMYDKGLLVGIENKSRMDYRPDPEPTDPTLKFYKSRDIRQVTPTMDGKVPIYDFDSWSKSHYGDLFHRSQYEKDFIKKKAKKRVESVESAQQENFIYLMLVIGGLFIVLVSHGTTDYDRDLGQKRLQHKEKNREN